ncbi:MULTISPECIES: DUF1566 domain-containing protein [Sorangium]|uniref:Lcl C-terminal domain-containing protein n=1 Tax=Sorangium TaxID=39643 RepID=UPI003D9C1546
MMTSDTSETVFDRVTELRWQRGLAPHPDTGKLEPMTWDVAKRACDVLDLEGFDDWRLPSRIELVSIVNHKKVSPAIPDKLSPTETEELFHGTVNTDYLWSSTPLARPPDPERPDPPPPPTSVWCVHVLDGSSAGCAVEESKPARCIRGGKATSGERCVNELDSSGKTVTDKQTGLTWQRDGDGNAYTRAAAAKHCDDLELAGLTWRLPTVQELLTIVDHARPAPALDPDSFPAPEPCHMCLPEAVLCECPNWYWSSTDYAYMKGDKKQAWKVGFGAGYEDAMTEESHGRVRCVANDGC